MQTGKKMVAEPNLAISIAGKDGQREDLKAGQTCTIDYTPGGDNEPSLIGCK